MNFPQSCRTAGGRDLGAHIGCGMTTGVRPNLLPARDGEFTASRISFELARGGSPLSAGLNHCTGHVTSANPHEVKNPNCLRISPHRPCRLFPIRVRSTKPMVTVTQSPNKGARPMLMSERTAQIENARMDTMWREGEKLADQQRQSFLDKLNVQSSSVAVKGKIWLGDWLYHWIADRVASPRPFTDSDRTFIDKLRRQHEPRLS